MFLMIIFMISNAVWITSARPSAQEKEHVAYAVEQAILAHNVATRIFDNKGLLDRDLCLAIGEPRDLDYLLLKVALQPCEIPLILNLYKNIMHKYDMQVCSDFESLYYQRFVSFIGSLRTIPPDDKQKLYTTLQILKDDHALVIPLIKFGIRFMSIVMHERLSIPLKIQNINTILDDFNEECRAVVPLHKGSDAVQLNAYIDQFNTGFKKNIFDDNHLPREVWWKRLYRAVNSQRSLLGLNMVGVSIIAGVSIGVVYKIRNFMNTTKTKADNALTQASGLMTDANNLVGCLKDSGPGDIASKLIIALLDNSEKVKKLYLEVFSEESGKRIIEAQRAIYKKETGKDLSDEELKEMIIRYYAPVPQGVSEKVLIHLTNELLTLVKKGDNDPESAEFKKFCFGMAELVVKTLLEKGIIKNFIAEGLSKGDNNVSTLLKKLFLKVIVKTA